MSEYHLAPATEGHPVELCRGTEAIVFRIELLKGDVEIALFDGDGKPSDEVRCSDEQAAQKMWHFKARRAVARNLSSNLWADVRLTIQSR